MLPLQGRLRRLELISVALIFLGLAGLLVYQAARVGITVDEPAHLIGAYLYWEGRDRLLPQDMPPLIKIAGGLMAQEFDLPLPEPIGFPGESRHEWTVALQMMEKLDRKMVGEIFFRSRLPMIVFPLLTLLLLWHWARHLFHPATAIVVALLFVLEPTARAHGPLFKNDLAATFTWLLFWFCCWRYWLTPTLANGLLAGAAAVLACIAKLSLLICVPLAIAVFVIRAATLRRARPLLHLAGALALAYFGILAAYQFDARRLNTYDLEKLDAATSSPALKTAAQALRFVPVPLNLWEGVTSVLRYASRTSPTYLLGQLYEWGHPGYFLVALAVKSPVSILILLAAGVALVGWTWRTLPAGAVFWLLPGALYLGLASLSNLQMGFRLVLPALPFGLLVAGVAVDRMWQNPRRVALIALLALLAFESLRVFPNGIGFFNLIAGGPEHGLQYLADSNVDWGQGLPALAAYVNRHRIQKVQLSYFGVDTIFRFLDRSRFELIAPPWGDRITDSPRFEPGPGYYAISASLLPGHYFSPQRRDYYEAFRKMKPIARPGGSIYLYQVGTP